MKPGIVVYKMTGSGNDFVFVDGRMVPLADWTAEQIRQVCARGTGVGADGLVVLEPGSQIGAVRFHFFNNDGSRAAMCGNAALCATRLAAWLEMAPADGMTLETDSGNLASRCLPGPGERAELSAPPPATLVEPDIEPAEGEQAIVFTSVGVPHLVVLVDDLAAVAVLQRGRELRCHSALQPEGANINFVSNARGGVWAMRTYERGVEAETLACGTGAVACAAALCRSGTIRLPWDVRTSSGTTLTVRAEPAPGGGFKRAFLAGEGRLILRGVLS